MKKVLVIEDNATNMYMMWFMLTENGYQVVKAEDGNKGIKRAVAEKPDLILMDMQLPVIDGYEATRQIKAIDELSVTPIIALTSYAMVGDKEKALEAGCDGYIEKPINPETLMKEIEKFLV
jgi:CheY-like chemotaxis protein